MPEYPSGGSDGYVLETKRRGKGRAGGVREERERLFVVDPLLMLFLVARFVIANEVLFLFGKGMCETKAREYAQ